MKGHALLWRAVTVCVTIAASACHPTPNKPVHEARRTVGLVPSASAPVTISTNTESSDQSSLIGVATGAESVGGDAGVPAPEPVYPFQQVDVLKRPVARTAPARRNANLSSALCTRELRTKKYPFKRVGAFKGIATPVRVDGDIEGVKFRVPGLKSKFGVLDCRLALTLVDFARFLKAASVTEVTVDNFYRPNAHLPGKRSKRSQHAYGLAIDLTTFKLADGRLLHVENDWGAGIETEPCGPYATLTRTTSNTVELRELVCNLAAQQMFHHHLTPSYDLAHRNHLHLDVKRDEDAVTVR